MLGKVVGETQRNWDLHVPAAAAAYRASEHVVTGFMPNFMMICRDIRAPMDIAFEAPAGEEEFWTARTSSSPTPNRDIEGIRYY